VSLVGPVLRVTRGALPRGALSSARSKHCSDKVVNTQAASAALVEVVHDLGCFPVRKVVAQVNHGPSEVLSIHAL